MKYKIKKLRIRKLMNTRDLGGLTTKDGRRIRKGKLIRSGKLYKLPARSKRKLERLGVNLVVDLRMEAECREYPCSLPSGAEYCHLPLLCTMKAGITHEKKMKEIMRDEGIRIRNEYADVDDYMMEMYREIVSLPEHRKSLAGFLKIAVRHDGCLMWCCTAGKDRTGICAMLLESLLGVEDGLIMEDYTSSYRFQRWKRDPQKILLWLLPGVPRSFRAILIAMMNAKPKYLNAALGYIKENYGSVEDYCKEALGVTDEDIIALKDKYLEK